MRRNIAMMNVRQVFDNSVKEIESSFGERGNYRHLVYDLELYEDTVEMIYTDDGLECFSVNISYAVLTGWNEDYTLIGKVRLYKPVGMDIISLQEELYLGMSYGMNDASIYLVLEDEEVKAIKMEDQYNGISVTYSVDAYYRGKMFDTFKGHSHVPLVMDKYITTGLKGIREGIQVQEKVLEVGVWDDYEQIAEISGEKGLYRIGNTTIKLVVRNTINGKIRMENYQVPYVVFKDEYEVQQDKGKWQEYIKVFMNEVK